MVLFRKNVYIGAILKLCDIDIGTYHIVGELSSQILPCQSSCYATHVSNLWSTNDHDETPKILKGISQLNVRWFLVSDTWPSSPRRLSQVQLIFGYFQLNCVRLFIKNGLLCSKVISLEDTLNKCNPQ